MKRRLPPLKSLTEAVKSSISLLLFFALVACSGPASSAMPNQEQAPAAADAKLSNDQLDSLVAPIALYPDPIMSQVLVASTYPLEIVQLSQWMQKNSKTPPDKMAEAVKKENWDPSVQAMVVLPDLVKNLNDNIKWTTDLGNAFLAQQNDVMDAVQRMRKKAKDKGALQSTEQQKVETKTVEGQQVIIIQPVKTEVVYVPTYNPTVVYGPPPVPYPVYAYPPPPPPGAYVASAAISFGVGMMVGAAWGNNYCCNAGWGGGNNNITINNNNTYVNNSNKQNIQGGNRVNTGGGNNSWQHNPQHRAGTPYPNQASAQKYGGQSNQNRQSGGGRNQPQAGGRQQPRASNNSVGGQAGNRGASVNNTSAQAGNRGASASTANRGGGGAGGNQIGNQSVSSGSRGGSNSAFGGSGNSRASANASSARGSSSTGGSRGGGGGSRSGAGGGRKR